MSDPHSTTEQLADLADGVLADEQAEAALAHLAGCASCASVRDQLAALPAMLAATSAPPMPAAVAGRLDAVVAAESVRRAAQQESPDTAVVVVPLKRLRRDRARHWFAGAATAAAVLVAISVVPDLVGGSGSDAEDSAAGGATLAQSDRPAGEDATGATGRIPVPDLDSADFAAGVELLHDSGAPQYRALSRPSTSGVDGSGSFEGQRLVPGVSGCRTRSVLTSAGDTGFALARVDGDLALLAASGPTRQRTVEAYSCDTGNLLAAAEVDLGP